MATTFKHVSFAELIEALYVEGVETRAIHSMPFSREASSRELAFFQASDGFESETRWYDPYTLTALVLSSGTFVATVFSSNAIHFYIGREET